VHLPTVVVQILFVVQLPVCLYGGYRIARHTGRSMLTWLVLGFLAAIAYPPLGAVIVFVLFLVVPAAAEPDARAPGEEPAGTDEGQGPDTTGDAPLHGVAR
jgi:hypothetical protein